MKIRPERKLREIKVDNREVEITKMISWYRMQCKNYDSIIDAMTMQRKEFQDNIDKLQIEMLEVRKNSKKNLPV